MATKNTTNASVYIPNIYVYLAPYKLQTEIDAFITAEITPKGKMWGAWWENINFNGSGVVTIVTEAAGDMGYSTANMARLQNIANNVLVTAAGDVDGNVGVMLADSTLRANAVTAIVSHVTTYGFQGVNVNFEPIASLSGTVLTNFTSFITALKAALVAANPAYILTWAGQLAWDSDVPNKEYSSVNYTGESNMAGTNNLSVTINGLKTMGFDIVEMQAYDQFYDFGLTEFGITSPDQVTGALTYTQNRLSKANLGMIIGTYGVQMNSGTDVYGVQGSQVAVEGNNLTRAEITAKSATFYSAGTRQNNQYLLQTVDTSIGTATMTIASPCVVTRATHGLEIGDSITFTTTGALPTGLTASTTYYVISAGFTVNTFRLAATVGGTAINTSGSQSGTHTLKRRTNITAPDQQTIDTYYAICKNKEVKYIGFWLCGDYYYPSIR